VLTHPDTTNLATVAFLRAVTRAGSKPTAVPAERPAMQIAA
jgi:hypothetical protein